MSIDLTTETPITLAKAAQTLPGGAVHVSTIHRWRMKGVRGVRLETFLRGGIRYTTDEAIERFFAATTAAADGDATPVRTSRQRERAIEQAERELSRGRHLTRACNRPEGATRADACVLAGSKEVLSEF